MFTRLLNTFSDSSFLFGPRGTGKSTWIKENFPDALVYDLLNTSETLRLTRDPSIIYHEVNSLRTEKWVVIDEVQKVPSLLNEVHRLIEEKKYKFILSGSSARKLKKESDNLLAGRARQTYLYPLVSAEVDYKIDLQKTLQFGMLPISFTSNDPQSYLKSYAETYLQEEIKAEALTRNIASFVRFLEIASRQNGQVTNMSSLSRDAGVARQTVQNYFELLVDTLVGSWLPTWKLKSSTKQVSHPKFFLFDSGVVRALSGRLPYPPTHEEAGPLLETFIINELKAYLHYTNKHYPLFYWRNHNGVEVDFFFETQSEYIGIECKLSANWENKYNKGLNRMLSEIGKQKVKLIGIYSGKRKAKYGEVEVYPVLDFLKTLWSGELFE